MVLSKTCEIISLCHIFIAFKFDSVRILHIFSLFLPQGTRGGNRRNGGGGRCEVRIIDAVFVYVFVLCFLRYVFLPVFCSVLVVFCVCCALVGLLIFLLVDVEK